MSASATAEAFYTKVDLTAGQIEHQEWSKANPVKITQYWSGVEAPAGRQAEVRLLWSNEALNVRFACRQTEPLVVNPTPQTTTKTLGLWDRDVCEIFIAPDLRKPERYFEFEVAPTGEWIDLAIHWKQNARETDWEFHSGMTVAGQAQTNQVMIAMRIPWNDWIRKPLRGERWRVNLFRCVGSGKDRGYLAWQPTHTPQPNFHVPQAFGELVFL